MTTANEKETIGYKHNAEIRAKISQKVRGLKKTAEHRSKISETCLGKLKSDAHRENIAKGMKASWARRKQRVKEEA